MASAAKFIRRHAWTVGVYVLLLAFLAFTVAIHPTFGAFEVQSDCIVNFEFTPDDSAARSMKLRGIVVSAGKEILAIQTDPGQSVAARFIAR